MAYKNPENPNCPNCNKSGLAILPVRYAVVPKEINATLPAPLGNKVSDVEIKYHKYALRTLRSGFLYLFHEKHARGSHITWEIYSVTEAGTLWKQLSLNATKMHSEPTCSTKGAHNIPASVVTIESPERCKRVWIAFSEHLWSSDTLRAFARDSALRDRRMQCFEPAAWITAGGYRHGLNATKENIEKILEYKPDFKERTLNGPEVLPSISAASGKHIPTSLTIQTTRYPSVSRVGQSTTLSAVMEKIGENNKSKNHPPIVLALWDAVGITHELNGFRNDTAGWVEKYNFERGQQVSAMLAIEGFKQALSKSASDRVEKFQQQIIDQGSEYKNLDRRRSNAENLRPGLRRKNELEVCAILEGWKQRKVPAMMFSTRLNISNEKIEPQRSIEIAQIQSEVEAFLIKRSNNADRNIEAAKENSWSKYEKYLGEDSASKKKLYQIFKENHDEFQKSVDRIKNERTMDLVEWLGSKYLVNAFSEFHQSNFEDGVVFDNSFGTAIFGINSSEVGRLKLDAWIKEAKASEANLLWRSIALNQSACLSELDEYLLEAERNAKANTPANADTLFVYVQKSLKAFVDTYKKFASLNASNTDAINKTAVAFGVPLNKIDTRKTDLVIMTAGDKLFKLFGLNGILDRQSEYLIQHLFTIRSLVDPQESINLIKSQIKNSPEVRRLILEQLRGRKRITAAGRLSGKSPYADALEKGWKNFKETSAKADGALKDARLALLIMLIEGFNFAKLMSDCMQKGDAKSWWSLAASGMTITSAMFDLASVPMKNSLPGKGDSLTYQRIKLIGGVLSAGAAAATVIIDLEANRKALARGDTGVAALYQFKIVFGLANVGTVALTTFTYAAPVIEKLTGSAAAATGARELGKRATSIVATRILFMAAGAWITVITFGIQILIWIFNKDELQSWCRLCPFGVANKVDAAFKSLKEQDIALQKVLIEMGMLEDKTPKDYPKVYPTLEEMMNHD